MTKPLQNGIIAGLVGVILSYVLYMINYVYLFSFGRSIAVFIIVLLFMIFSAKHTKKELGGYISLQEALKAAWIPGIIAVVLLAIFMFLMFNVIDPSLVDKMTAFVMEKMEKIMELIGGNEEAMESVEKELSKAKNKYSIGNVLLSAATSTILHFIPAIIIASILKKENPETQLAS